MRVLHLIESDSPQADATTLALMGSALGRMGRIDQRVLLLGGATLRRTAQAAGLNGEVAALGVPFGRALLGWPALTRRIAAMGRFDVIHCWSGGALSWATLAMPHVPRVMTLTQPPSSRAVHWFRTLGREAHRPAIFLPISSTLRRALLAGGVTGETVHVLRPGIDLSRVEHARRAELRKAWGIAPAEDATTKIVALLSDPPTAGDAREAALTIGIVEEILDNVRIHLLVHPGASRRRHAELMLRTTRGGRRLIRESELAQPWRVLAGCDLALACGHGGGGLSLLWAMAANIPIIGEATYAISEILEDRHSALLAKPNQQKELIKRIMRLLRDEQLAYKLRDTARHEAYSYFSRQRYCQSLEQVYEQLLAGTGIEVPALPVTGGLRFSGRA